MPIAQWERIQKLSAIKSANKCLIHLLMLPIVEIEILFKCWKWHDRSTRTTSRPNDENDDRASCMANLWYFKLRNFIGLAHWLVVGKQGVNRCVCTKLFHLPYCCFSFYRQITVARWNRRGQANNVFFFFASHAPSHAHSNCQHCHALQPHIHNKINRGSKSKVNLLFALSLSLWLSRSFLSLPLLLSRTHTPGTNVTPTNFPITILIQ